MLSALPFAIIALISVSRLVIGPELGPAALLAVSPAVAAAVGGLLYMLAAGVVALAVCLLFAVGLQPGATHRMEIAFLAVTGVTAAGVCPGAGARVQAWWMLLLGRCFPCGVAEPPGWRPAGWAAGSSSPGRLVGPSYPAWTAAANAAMEGNSASGLTPAGGAGVAPQPGRS